MSEFRTDTSKLSKPELALAQNLIEAMSGEYNPIEFKDTYRDRVRAMIDAKVKGQKTVQPPEPQELAPVIDIMDALKRSLNSFKKPAISETAPIAIDTKAAKPRATKAPPGLDFSREIFLKHRANPVVDSNKYFSGVYALGQDHS